jgi:glycosyltransferase involved in cell wall biosynthesis
VTRRTWDAVDRPTISALITCFNEERRIPACIEGLSWCDEILVVDSHSTDRTVEIARSYPKVELIQHKYFGGAAQKNWAMERVKCDWVLIFDADEVCTPELKKEIQAILLEGPRHNGYHIHRCMYFLGKRIRFSGWQHDKVARLFKRGTARYQDRRVHSRLMTDGPAPLLKNSMDHFMVDSLAEYIKRTANYSYLGAAQNYRDGRRARWNNLTIGPSYRFVRTFFIQFGFLDGWRGLVFCVLQAAGSFFKWATLWSWQINEARGIPPDLPEFEDGYGSRKSPRLVSTAGRQAGEETTREM